MNLKPEHRQKLIQALIAFITIVLSVVSSIITDALTTIGELPILITPTPFP